jgi:acetyl esterase/lipase
MRSAQAGTFASIAAVAIAVVTPAAHARKIERPTPTVERDVVYGMVSGAALLLDVHRPANANGYGIVFVAGSGWQADPAYGARPIKETQIDLWGPPLTAAGYTVFSVNHRGAPRFHYPAAIDDVQRAIRFVRANAARFGIDGARLGGLGGSSGGNLIALAALRAGPGIPDEGDAVNREPATLQTIVLRAAVTDLRALPTAAGANLVVAYMESPPGGAASALYDAASPITQVRAGAPPTLLIHGDADDLIPYAQSLAMQSALAAASVEVRLVTVPGGRHGADFGVAGARPAGWPNYYLETVAWFDRHLRRH